MLTRRQLAMAPVLKTVSERCATAFGREVVKVLEAYMGTVDFGDCGTQRKAVDLLYRHVRKALRGKGLSFARHGYIAKRMCKVLIGEIVLAGLSGLKEDRHVDTNG